MGKKLLNELKEFAKEINVDSMYLFGSRAWGKAKKDSDVDLLLVSDRFKGVRRLRRSPALHLKWDLKYPVDFICLTSNEFKEKKNQIGVIQEAVKKGIKIL